MELLFYGGIGLGMFMVSEVGAYVWHRWFAHQDIISMVRKTHDIHHKVIKDKAHGDFFFVLILLSLYLGCLLFLYFYYYINVYLLLSLYIPVFLTFTFSYYLHTAFHTEDHWLNEYEWFRNDKRIHFQHHVNEGKNYGIVTHYTDLLLDTFDSGFPIHNLGNNVEENE